MDVTPECALAAARNVLRGHISRDVFRKFLDERSIELGSGYVDWSKFLRCTAGHGEIVADTVNRKAEAAQDPR